MTLCRPLEGRLLRRARSETGEHRRADRLRKRSQCRRAERSPRGSPRAPSRHLLLHPRSLLRNSQPDQNRTPRRRRLGRPPRWEPGVDRVEASCALVPCSGYRLRRKSAELKNQSRFQGSLIPRRRPGAPPPRPGGPPQRPGGRAAYRAPPLRGRPAWS